MRAETTCWPSCRPEGTGLASELRRTFRENWLNDADGTERLLMGPRATLSAGLAVVHYKEDLRFALDEARKAEKRAKKRGPRRAGNRGLPPLRRARHGTVHGTSATSTVGYSASRSRHPIAGPTTCGANWKRSADSTSARCGRRSGGRSAAGKKRRSTHFFRMPCPHSMNIGSPSLATSGDLRIRHSSRSSPSARNKTAS